MNREGMLKPALIGGVLVGVLSSVPFVGTLNCFCCAWVIAGGMLSAYLLVKESPFAVTLGRGVALGLLTGAIGAVVDTLFSIPIQMLLSRAGINVLDQLRTAADQLPSLPPEVREMFRSIPAGGLGLSLMLLIAAGLLKLVIYSLVAMIGGALGVALFEKRRPGEPSATPTAYPPPPPQALSGP